MIVKAGWLHKDLDDPNAIYIFDDDESKVKIPVNKVRILTEELKATLLDYIDSEEFTKKL